MGNLRVPGEDVQVAWLPPPEMRLWDVEKQGRIETPLDGRGLVDLDSLVTVGRQTVDPEFSWASPFNDVHHLQWPAAHYAEPASPLAHDFRELSRRKALLPRLFHNWLHVVTELPPLPSEEAMRNAIRAEQTAKALAHTARLAVRLTRLVGIPEIKLGQRLDQEFENYSTYIENARLVPEEFQLLKIAEVEAKSVDEMLAANKRLGKLALHLPLLRQRELISAA